MLQQLDSDQKKAATFGTGPLLIQAGPGAGKTRVLTSRISFLIAEGIASPAQILAITFTNQAAGEIQSRLDRMLSSPGQDEPMPMISTFHGWARKFLEHHSADEPGSVIDETETRQIISICMRNAGIKGLKKRAVQQRISFLKQRWPPLLDNESAEFMEIWKRYHRFLVEYNLMDYDDLILEANRMLEQGDIKTETQANLPFILVDEFQDVSPAQYNLVRLLSPTNGNLTVIGDPYQSIYGFRGASPVFMEKFIQDFDKVQTVRLHNCYRCPENHINAALSVVNPSGKLHMHSTKPGKKKISVLSFASAKSEASWIAREIEKLAGGLSFDSINAGVADGDSAFLPGDIAVLYRNMGTGAPVARELEKRGVPFQHIRGNNPLDSPKIRLIMRLWEVSKGKRVKYNSKILHKETEISRDLINNFATQNRNKKNPELIREIMDFLGIDHYAPDMKGMIKRVEEMPREESLSLLLQKEADSLDLTIEAVTLLSIHAAKGLEFPVVFIMGCEDGIIPWHSSNIDEERRIFYVALSRASERLYISWSKKRLVYGNYMQSEPSPFLSNIPETIKEIKEHKKYKKKKRPKQLTLF